MASMFFFSCSILHYKNHLATTRGFDVCKPLCSSSQSKSMVVTEDKSLNRRSANYAPSLWSFEHVQSLSSKYTEEDYEARAYSSKKAVKTMIQKVTGNT
ncbi:hypothetical protein Ccrd_007471 [Cynara cardunculus var. scolymus]|uniref:Uncharacterized protein n=1 Tax=Cynara cardunculus var. scolymus TaxID=59895 RepID=A0A103XGX1_CYNCS|nr:hypothetical protein Ccrd_007471 [Cynara cardunculus var. scolymus]